MSVDAVVGAAVKRSPKAIGTAAETATARWLQDNPTRKQSRPEVRPCLVDGCDADERVGGMCAPHYRRALAERKATVTCTICEAAAILAGRGAALSEVAATIRKHPGWLVEHLRGHGNAALLGV